VDGDRVKHLAPDPDHPVSRGYACTKGLRFHERLHAPERLLHPLLRPARSAPLRRATWEEALALAGTRLRTALDDHGREAVGLYLGNAVIHNFGAVVGTAGLARALGTRKTYSSLTLDNAPQFVVLEAVLGSPTTTFTADYENSDCIVLFGTDPLASQPSQSQANPEGVRHLLRARTRLVVVDPRRSTTARHAALHLAIRPGTDRFLLACLVRAFVDPDEPRRAGLGAAVAPDDLAVLRQATERFTPEHVAPIVGLSVATIAALVARLRASARPLVWSGLGVLLAPDATVGWWLTLVLQTLLGGLDAPGGWVRPGAAADLGPFLRLAGLRGADPDNRSRIGGFPAVLGTHAAATLADDILTEGPDRLRALVVVGGNPARACPDSPKLVRALGALDLLVSVDAFANETTAHADVVLPAATWLERDDTTLHLASQKPLPHVQVGRAVVPPPGEARDDGWIAGALAHAAGRPLFGSHLVDVTLRWLGLDGLVDIGIHMTSPLSGSAVRAAPRGLVVSRPKRPPPLVPRLAHAPFVVALGGMAPSTAVLTAVTSVRPVTRMNTWLGPREAAPARFHPADAERHAPTGVLRLCTRDGQEVDVLVVPDDAVREGTIVMPFGEPVAAAGEPGAIPANALLTAAPLDPFSGQPVSNGAGVRLSPVGASGPTAK
jgi:formate dehydrogenase